MTIPVRRTRRVVDRTVGGFPELITHNMRLENAAHLLVFADELQLTLGTDYTIDGIGNAAGFSVRLRDFWRTEPEVERIALDVRYPINQPSDIDQGGAFGRRFEDSLDRMAFGQQTLFEQGFRSLKMDPGFPANVEVGVEEGVPGWLLQWDNLARRVIPVDPEEFRSGRGDRGPVGEPARAFETNAALQGYNDDGLPLGSIAIVRRSQIGRITGGGMWRLTTTPPTNVNGLTVIPSFTGRFWEKISGGIDGNRNQNPTSHPQSIGCFEIRVPSQFASITAAIDYLSQFEAQRGAIVDIYLETGFVMREQVMVCAANMGWMTIFAQDADVKIDTNFLTLDRTGALYGVNTRAAFTVIQGGISPRFGCIFDMQSPGHPVNLDRHGLFVTGAGSCAHMMNFRGFKNSGTDGIYANRGGYINAYGADVSGAARYGVYANRAMINCHNANASNCGVYGLIAIYASRVSATGMYCDNAGSVGCYVNFGGIVTFNNAFARDCALHGVWAMNGSTCEASNTVVDRAGERGVWAAYGARVNFSEGSAMDCGTYGIFANELGNINAIDTRVDNAGDVGYRAAEGSTINARRGAAPNCGNHNLLAINGSTINFSDGIANSGRGVGGRASSGSSINAPRAQFNNNAGNGLEAIEGGEVSISGGSARGNGARGVYANSRGIANVNNADCSGNTIGGAYAAFMSQIAGNGSNFRSGGADAATDAVIFSGSQIDMNGATGGVNVAANTLSPAGIVYRG